MTNWRRCLTAAGLLSLAVAALHVGIIIAGAPAYRNFGAGEEMARLAAAGSPLPALLTLCIAIVFAAFGAYALCGAGLLRRRLPLLASALLAIGAVYTLRGLAAFGQAWQMLSAPAGEGVKELIFSTVSLLIGALYLGGVAGGWARLKKARANGGALG